MIAFPRRVVRNVRAWMALAVVLAGAPGLRAHDPFELTTIVQLTSTALLLEITATRVTAMKLATNDPASVGFEPENFAQHQPALAACAPGLYEVSAGGERLEMEAVEVSLGIENDVEWRVRYPLPKSGPLRLYAPHVPQLGQGFGNLLTAHTATGALLGQTLLMDQELTFSAELPAAALAPRIAPGASAPAGVDPARAAAVATRVHDETGPVEGSFNVLLAAGCATAVGLLVFWSRRR